MNRSNVGRLHRLLRHRAGLTQAEVATRAGLGRWKVVALEADRLDQLRFGDVDRCLGVLGARLYVNGWYRGAAVDRLLDENHALLVAACLVLLERHGWSVRVEVSYSERGEHGSIDVLGWHAPTSSLLIAEIKSELGAIEGTLRPLDIKSRLAAKVARDRFGWHAGNVSRSLVLPESRTVRRQVERHERVLQSALPARSRELRQWVARPVGAIAGIWCLTDMRHSDAKRNPSAIQRVRKAQSCSARAASRSATASDPRNVEMSTKCREF